MIALVTGAFGQLGTDLVPRLLLENFSVVVVAHKTVDSSVPWFARVKVVHGNVTDAVFVRQCVLDVKPDVVFHLAGVLSAVGESDPLRAWAVNVDSVRFFLDAAASVRSFRLFWASSIAVFGPNTPKLAPEDGPFGATTIYGIGKLAAEGLCEWYARNRGVDVRVLRFPGLVSFSAEPGGGAKHEGECVTFFFFSSSSRND
jgi:nucleoside-diphosphate-sugar epimerase